jgi:hypothetical protein
LAAGREGSRVAGLGGGARLLGGFESADLFLEIAHELGMDPAVVAERAKASWELVGL